MAHWLANMPPSNAAFDHSVNGIPFLKAQIQANTLTTQSVDAVFRASHLREQVSRDLAFTCPHFYEDLRERLASKQLLGLTELLWTQVLALRHTGISRISANREVQFRLMVRNYFYGEDDFAAQSLFDLKENELRLQHEVGDMLARLCAALGFHKLAEHPNKETVLDILSQAASIHLETMTGLL